MPPPLQVDNIFAFIRQVAGLFRHVGYLRHQQQVDLLTAIFVRIVYYWHGRRRV